MIVSWKKFIAAVLLILLLSAVEVSADRMRPTIEYSTTGAIDRPFSGSPVVTFQGIADGSLTAGDRFNLGSFAIAPGAKASSTYAGRFEITFQAISVDGVPLPPDSPKAIIRGHIDGTAGGGAPNNLTLYFGDVAPFSGIPFEKTSTLLQAGSISENISIDGSQLMGFSSSTATSVPVFGMGEPGPTLVPEPATLAVFLVGFSIVLFALNKRRYLI